MKKMYLILILLSLFLSSCGPQQVVDSNDIRSISVGLSLPYNVLLEKMTDRERMSSIANIINDDAKNSVKSNGDNHDMIMEITSAKGETVIERISADTFMMQSGKSFKSETLGKYFSELKTSGIQKLKTNPPVVKFSILNYTKSDVDSIRSNPPEEIKGFANIYNISDTIPDVRSKYEDAIVKKAAEVGLNIGKALEIVSKEMKDPYLPVYCIYSDYNNEKAWIISVIFTDYPSTKGTKDRFELNSNLKKIRSFVVTPDGKLLYSN